MLLKPLSEGLDHLGGPCRRWGSRVWPRGPLWTRPGGGCGQWKGLLPLRPGSALAAPQRPGASVRRPRCPGSGCAGVLCPPPACPLPSVEKAAKGLSTLFPGSGRRLRWCGAWAGAIRRALSPMLRAEVLARRWGHRAAVRLRPFSRPPSHRASAAQPHISQSVSRGLCGQKEGPPRLPRCGASSGRRLLGKPSAPGAGGSPAPPGKAAAAGALQGGHSAREGPASAHELTIGTSHLFLFEELCANQQWITSRRQRGVIHSLEIIMIKEYACPFILYIPI